MRDERKARAPHARYSSRKMTPDPARSRPDAMMISHDSLLRARFRPLLLLAGLMIMAGCSSTSPTGPGDAWPTQVLITPSEVVLVSLGQVQELHAVVRDQLGRDLSGLPLEWSVDDNAIVSLEADGRFRALANGTTTVTARVQAGSVPDGTRPFASATIVVEQKIDRLTLTPSRPILWAIGQVRSLVAQAVDALGNPVESADPIVWATSDPEVAGIDQEGKVRAVGTGEVEVVAQLGDLVASTSLTVSPRAQATVCLASAIAPSGDDDSRTCASASVTIYDSSGFGVYVTR